MKKLSLKKMRIILMIISLLVSIFSLAFILIDETKHKISINETQKIHFIGDYKTENDLEFKKIPNDYVFNLSGKNKIIFKGNFTSMIPLNKLLIMRMDNLKIKLFLNDYLYYEYGNKNNLPSYADSAGNKWSSFISPGILSTDEIILEIENNYNNHSNVVFELFFENLYCGYEKDIILSNIRANIFNMVISLFIIFLGIVSFIFAIILKQAKKSVETIVIFSLLAVFSGVWFLIDFTVVNYYIPFPIFVNSLDVLCLFFMTTFLLVYFALNFKNKFRILLFICALISLLIPILSSITQIFGIADYYEYYYMIAIVSHIFIGIIIFNLIMEVKNNHKVSKIFLISCLVICLGATIDIFCMLLQWNQEIFWFKITFMVFIILQFLEIIGFLKETASSFTKSKVLKAENEGLKKLVEYQQLLTKVTRSIYDEIYEIDATNNKIISEIGNYNYINSEQNSTLSADDFIKKIVNTRVKEEFRQNYLDVFLVDNIKKAYENGIDELNLDYMISFDNHEYSWMRVIARIFFWENDKTIRVLKYHQNIDDEKIKEMDLIAQAKLDSLTGLYNKIATENLVKESIEKNKNQKLAFFILDIDDFKHINDTYGHIHGDRVIRELSRLLKINFKDKDIVGRIGGDEFVVCLAILNEDWLKSKAKELTQNLSKTIFLNETTCKISVSVGIALYPNNGNTFEELYCNADKALYKIKNTGKGNFGIYSQFEPTILDVE